MIPATAHFIWFGTKLPYIYTLAVRSACLAGGFDRVKLHADPALLADPHVAALRDLPAFSLEPLVPGAVLEACALPGLLARYERLKQPAGKANVVRLALLDAEGGVYLDTDTLTVKPIPPLLTADAFVGEEILVRPYWVARSGSKLEQGKKHLRGLVRKACTLLPHGYRAFSPLSRLFLRGVNNAVMGARPKAPLVRGLLEGILEVPEDQLLTRYRLGTHLLQETLRAHPERAVVHPPEVFYPLGPELSRHWFVDHGVSNLPRVVTEATIIVHWYASVKTDRVVAAATPEWIRAHADSQLFSHLAMRFL